MPEKLVVPVVIVASAAAADGHCRSSHYRRPVAWQQATGSYFASKASASARFGIRGSHLRSSGDQRTQKAKDQW